MIKYERRATFDLPISAVHGNIIFSHGHAAAVYRVDTVSFEFLSDVEKRDLHKRLARWMLDVGANFSIYRVCREYPAGSYVADTVDMLDERYADRASWESMLIEQAAHMGAMRSFTPEVYFVVSLDATSWAPWRRGGRDLKIFSDAEANALETLTNRLHARRARTREIQWLVRRSCVRGVSEPDGDPNWAPPALSVEGGVFSPGRADVQSFMPVVTERARYLSVSGEDGDSLQAMLVMGKPPKRAEFPGSAELLFGPLEGLDFPVDAVVHARWIPNKKMLSICDNAVKDARDELDDAIARFLDRKTKRRAQHVSDVQDYFASEPFPPGLDAFAYFAVSAPADEHDVLVERTKRLQRAYGSMRLYRPFALQADLFDEHMLRPDGAEKRIHHRDYRRLMIVEQLAAMMPIGANEGGSNRGFYIGYTTPGAKRPVKYDPLEASETNRAGAVSMNGTLGAGKTFALQLLVSQMVKRGSIGVDIDPRPDHSFEQLPGMEGRVHPISLSGDENAGLLDPLVVAPDSMKEELASEYMMEILPHATSEWQTEIIEAVRAVLRESNPCSWRVIEILLDSDDPNARVAGKALRTWATWGLGRLAFSRGDHDDVHARRALTTIKADALTLPPPDVQRASYSQSERVSVGTLKLMLAYAMRLVAGDASTHKFIVLDEAHALTGTPDGQRFLQRFLRMARSMNITVILASQLIGDMGPLEQLIGVRFAFRQETTAQAAANLRAFGLDDKSKALIDKLCGFTEGRCLMRGLDKRVISMRFDPADKAFTRLADTNPTRLEKVLV